MTEQLLSVGIDIGSSAPRDGSHPAGTPQDLKSSAEVNSACGNACGILRLTPSRFAGPMIVEVPT